MNELYPYLPNLLLAWSTYAIAAASPGPSNLAIMAAAMHRGRAPALALACGVITGSMTWAVLAALGVSTLLASWAQALAVLKLLGGGYLLWLAARSLRAALAAGDRAGAAAAGAEAPLRMLYLRGLALHLTNPKAVLAWIAIITLGLPAAAPKMVGIAIVAGCAMLGICIFVGHAMLFSAPPMVRAYRRARRGIEAALAVVFGSAGIRLLLSQP